MGKVLAVSDGTGDQDVMDFGFMIEDCPLVYSKRIPEGLPGHGIENGTNDYNNPLTKKCRKLQ
jgi:hypothetical protein